jgi:hypothetical protein
VAKSPYLQNRSQVQIGVKKTIGSENHDIKIATPDSISKLISLIFDENDLDKRVYRFPTL